ncbi:hypothetical protein [Campylobacter troglodytis]|uniref:hypothetical protein n=1 Tax=Campylobacter troglodytis TaxID=654363 RepID=UPI001159896B|nr:hypothetical protein [Campylobacter troglodytis]
MSAEIEVDKSYFLLPCTCNCDYKYKMCELTVSVGLTCLCFYFVLHTRTIAKMCKGTESNILNLKWVKSYRRNKECFCFVLLQLLSRSLQGLA